MVCAGSRALLQCNPGKRVKVTQARWGTDRSVACANSSYPGTVSLPLTSNTGSGQVTEQIKKRCAKQQNCEVEASASFFDDGTASIPSDAKYLKVWHECIPDVAGVILPSRRAKRDVRTKKSAFHVPQPIGAVSEVFNPKHESLESSASFNSSQESTEQSFSGGKSNEQITSSGSEEIRENVNLARMFDELLAPSTLNK